MWRVQITAPPPIGGALEDNYGLHSDSEASLARKRYLTYRGNMIEDIDDMYEDYIDGLVQEQCDEAWRNNPERPEIEAQMAWQERFDKTLRGKIFFWRVVEECSWPKTIWLILRKEGF